MSLRIETYSLQCRPSFWKYSAQNSRPELTNARSHQTCACFSCKHYVIDGFFLLLRKVRLHEIEIDCNELRWKKEISLTLMIFNQEWVVTPMQKRNRLLFSCIFTPNFYACPEWWQKNTYLIITITNWQLHRGFVSASEMKTISHPLEQNEILIHAKSLRIV